MSYLLVGFPENVALAPACADPAPAIPVAMLVVLTENAPADPAPAIPVTMLVGLTENATADPASVIPVTMLVGFCFTLLSSSRISASTCRIICSSLDCHSSSSRSQHSSCSSANVQAC